MLCAVPLVWPGEDVAGWICWHSILEPSFRRFVCFFRHWFSVRKQPPKLLQKHMVRNATGGNDHEIQLKLDFHSCCISQQVGLLLGLARCRNCGSSKTSLDGISSRHVPKFPPVFNEKHVKRHKMEFSECII